MGGRIDRKVATACLTGRSEFRIFRNTRKVSDGTARFRRRGPEELRPLSGQALAEPVIVTKYGRPSVVILSAGEYERLKRLDRQVLAVTDLSDDDIAGIEAARIPDAHRYHSDDLP